MLLWLRSCSKTKYDEKVPSKSSEEEPSVETIGMALLLQECPCKASKGRFTMTMNLKSLCFCPQLPFKILQSLSTFFYVVYAVFGDDNMHGNHAAFVTEGA